MSKVHNFSAGPGILPADVLKQSIEYIHDWMNENPLTFVKSANKV